MLKSVVIIVVLLGLVCATDYCSEEICAHRPGTSHISCNHSGNFSSSCPSDAKIIQFSKELKELAVDAHNRMRNKIASGEQSGFPSSSQMATMVNLTCPYVEFPKKIIFYRFGTMNWRP